MTVNKKVNTKGQYKTCIEKTIHEIKKQNRSPLRFGSNGDVTLETIRDLLTEPHNLAVLKRLAHK